MRLHQVAALMSFLLRSIKKLSLLLSESPGVLLCVPVGVLIAQFVPTKVGLTIYRDCSKITPALQR
ncbi:MAG: hypothetical protein DDG58_09715 [Ardenticatenia bacterium]|nr:MAG: hypothetical protein DDG58_09715 [Ardenticatenia bacterium]